MQLSRQVVIIRCLSVALNELLVRLCPTVCAFTGCLLKEGFEREQVLHSAFLALLVVVQAHMGSLAREYCQVIRVVVSRVVVDVVHNFTRA